MMRFTTTTIVLLLAVHAAVVFDIAYAQQQQQQQQQQQIALSDQCITETEQLANNPAIAATAPSAECSINLDTTSRSCTADFQPLSDDFQEACFSAGGRFYQTDVTHDCKTFLDGETYQVQYIYNSFPACVGSTCNDEELKNYYSTSVHPAMESAFAARGLTCDVTDTNAVSFDASTARASDSTPRSATSNARGVVGRMSTSTTTATMALVTLTATAVMALSHTIF